MPNHHNNQITLEQFVNAFNLGDIADATSLLTTNFFDYVPQPGEQTQPEAFQQIGTDLCMAMPDLHITLENVAPDDEWLRGRMRAQGTFSESLWNIPANNKTGDFAATVIARFEDGRMALKWEDVVLVEILRAIGLAPLPENGHRRPPFVPRQPEIILRLAWNGMRLQEKPCSHLDHIKVIEPAIDYCAECAKTGDEYPMLRMCTECGYVGCCDMSVNKHMKKHCEATGHPVIRSIQPGEAWLWCYPDSAFLSSRHLSSM